MSSNSDVASFIEWEVVSKEVIDFFQNSFEVDDDGVYYDKDGDIITRNQIRKSLYRFYIKTVHGNLGVGNRKQIPECVLVLGHFVLTKTGATWDINHFSHCKL